MPGLARRGHFVWGGQWHAIKKSHQSAVVLAIDREIVSVNHNGLLWIG
jgi:hypothetical protein